MAMIRCTPLMEQVCASLMLVRHHFLHTIHGNCIFLMFFVFPLPHVVCYLFHNLLVIIMSLLSFILSVSLSRIGTRGPFCLAVVFAVACTHLTRPPHLLCSFLPKASVVFVCLLHIGMRALVILLLL